MPVGQTEIAKIFDDFLAKSAKRKVKDAEGNTVEKWYDPYTKSWVIQKKDLQGNQIGNATYVHSKEEAVNEENRMKQERKTKDKLRDMKYQGLEIVIENEVGSKRNWVNEKGETGTITMQFPYGYIKGVKGNDGDELDCFIGNNPYAKSVYTVRQVNSLGYDEEKIMLGWDTIEEAKEAYLLHVNKEELLGDITEVPFKLFRETLDFVC